MNVEIELLGKHVELTAVAEVRVTSMGGLEITSLVDGEMTVCMAVAAGQWLYWHIVPIPPSEKGQRT